MRSFHTHSLLRWLPLQTADILASLKAVEIHASLKAVEIHASLKAVEIHASLKGTGFSPYIGSAKSTGALAPEGSFSRGLRKATPLFAACLIPGFLFFALASRANAQSPEVTLTPAVVEAGSPELIRVDAADAASIDGEWLGRKLQFFRGRDGRVWFALAGVDVEAPVGPATLRISLRLAQGGLRDLTRAVQIHPAHYRTGSLTVAPKFVEPDSDALKQIELDRRLKEKVFAASAPEPLWTGNYRAPVTAPPTDSFGTRRLFNGKLASIHKGMDFRAPTGTPVRAGNSGVVVLARPLYYEGNCVVIDHGLGLFTLYLHLSQIDVREGRQVAAGDRLGLSGATGRVTGPHLHWAVRWQGAYLDPAKLLRLDLNGLR
jgi:murein DD-endopeptidase MepM/ murein hydrolase activator NlpD